MEENGVNGGGGKGFIGGGGKENKRNVGLCE